MNKRLYLLALATANLASGMELIESDSASPEMIIEMGGAFASPDDTEQVAQVIVRDYCEVHEQISTTIAPYIRQRFNAHCHSPTSDIRQKAFALKKTVSESHDLKNADKEYVKELVLESVKDAFIEQQKQISHESKKLSKKKVAIVASIAGIISSLVTAIVTVIVSFNTKKCT